MEKFTQDLKSSEMISCNFRNVSDCVSMYNRTLVQLLNTQAPVKEKVVSLRPQAPWYTEQVRKAKQVRRQAERRWKKEKSTINTEILKAKQTEEIDIRNQAKKEYFNNKFGQVEQNSKELFRLANTLLHQEKN